MRLYSIEYTEFKEETYRWSLEELTLINLNLIVGRNATGKSRILRIIRGIADFINGNIVPTSIISGHFKAVFKDIAINSKSKPLKKDISYEFEILEGKVIKEILEVDGKEKLIRKDKGRGSIFFEQIDSFLEIQVPENNLAVSLRRDSKQHSFFEDLHNWAERVCYYEFAIKDQFVSAQIDSNVKPELFSNYLLHQNYHLLIKFGLDKFNRSLISPVTADMKKLGYEVSDFGLMPTLGVQSPISNSNIPQFVYIKEVGIDKKLPQTEISAGMFRALITLIQLHIIRLEKKPTCILIDDIGEGLDFDRSNKLISILIEHAELGFSQFIVTTNDRFIMNKVPLEYWCVLERELGKVKAYTPRNSQKTFADFEEFGFNNFDFFAKGFFSNSIKNK